MASCFISRMAITNDLPSVFCWVSQMASCHISSLINRPYGIKSEFIEASMLVHPQFDPVAIHLGPLAIHWYGLMYLAGFVAFLWLGRKRITMLNDPQFSAKLLDDLLFYGVLGVILGGRLGYVLFYKAPYYSAHPLEIFAVWQG